MCKLPLQENAGRDEGGGMRKIKAGGDEAQGARNAKKNPNVGNSGLLGVFAPYPTWVICFKFGGFC